MACCAFISPITVVISSCEVTTIQALPSAFGRQAFGDGLQVGHQLDVFGNVLADLIHKEIQTEIGRLALDVGIDLLGKIFDGDFVIAAVLIEDALGRCPAIAPVTWA